MPASHRNFPGDLNGVYDKLSLKPADVLNVYLIGSRMWGTASISSDHDLYLVVQGNSPARNSHFQIPGLNVDATVVGETYFQQRLNDAKLKELSCLWAPPACKLLERRNFQLVGSAATSGAAAGAVDRARLGSSLTAGYEKDWTRARKQIQGGRLEVGKKVLSHCVRAHLLSLQIVSCGHIVDYEAGKEFVEWLRGTYSKDWTTYEVEFEDKLAGIRDYVVNSDGAAAVAEAEAEAEAEEKEDEEEREGVQEPQTLGQHPCCPCL